MASQNTLRRFAEKANRYPPSIAAFLLTHLFRYKVKLAGTAKMDILHTDFVTVKCRLKNRKAVQNHIGGVHAAAMALLAESATGFIVGLNLPGDKLPLMKQMDLKYVRRARGSLTAVASLTASQIQQMEQQERGDMVVSVSVLDEDRNEPVICTMRWAWVTK